MLNYWLCRNHKNPRI